MKLQEDIRRAYCEDHISAREAQRMAQFISWGPMTFQTARLMLEHGVLEALRNAPDEGLSIASLSENTGLSTYALRVLTEASLSIGLVKLYPESGNFTLSKTGWFLLTDPSVRVNMDFNHHVNYQGLFRLNEALTQGRPAGLEHFGKWATIYEGLSELPPEVQKSWFAFDHFYSDQAFSEALSLIFTTLKPQEIFDMGGNTGRFALSCTATDPAVRVTVFDLPAQLAMLSKNIAGKAGAERISTNAIDFLSPSATLPNGAKADIVWMSQFLDCFSPEEIVRILRLAASALTHTSRLLIMETLWDRQRFETASLCLTMTSLYFAAMANGNSKMYTTPQLTDCIAEAGLQIEKIHDGLGLGHSILVCRLSSAGGQ